MIYCRWEEQFSFLLCLLYCVTVSFTLFTIITLYVHREKDSPKREKSSRSSKRPREDDHSATSETQSISEKEGLPPGANNIFS